MSVTRLVNHVDQNHLKKIRSTYIKDSQGRIICEGDTVEYEVIRCSANYSNWGRISSIHDGYFLITGVVVFKDGEFKIIGDEAEIKELKKCVGKEKFERNVWFDQQPLREAKRLTILNVVGKEIEIVSGTFTGNPGRIVREFANGKIQVRMPNGDSTVLERNEVAFKVKSPVADNFVKRLSAVEKEDLRCPLAVERDNWFKSEEGLDCCSGIAEGSFLKNRLELAFLAGAAAQEGIDNKQDPDMSGVGSYRRRMREPEED